MYEKTCAYMQAFTVVVHALPNEPLRYMIFLLS